VFGPRGTGKTTFIKEQFLSDKQKKNPQKYFWSIDLLDSDEEEKFSKDPKRIEKEYLAKPDKPEWIFVDEVQKVPKLLDHIQRMIENQKQKFILSGSSSRKLKTTGANLLAGRAFVYRLFPFTRNELVSDWNTHKALNWGTLPKVWSFALDAERKKFLKAYLQTYIKEEIRLEQVIRNLAPFREFLEIAAQTNGQPLNYHKLAKEIGISDKTVKTYYQILEDTFLGFHLTSFHRSIRKAQLESPKFYFFDTGVKRMIENSIDSPLVSGTSSFGETFEHLVIAEATRLNAYSEKDFRLSFFRSKEGQEIDLIVSLNRNTEILVEIKSSTYVDEQAAKKLSRLSKEFNAKGCYLLSLDPNPQKIENVKCLPWEMGLSEIFKFG